MTDSMTDTQNSAGDAMAALMHLEVFAEGEDLKRVRAVTARIIELEAHIAAEPDRMREVVERCAKVAEDYDLVVGFSRVPLTRLVASIRAQETA